MRKWKPVWLAGSFALAIAGLLGCQSPRAASDGCAGSCIAVPTTEKKSTWVYDSRTEQKCYLRPPPAFCDDSESPTCEQAPRTVVIKRRATTEVPTWKCQPAGAENPKP